MQLKKLIIDEKLKISINVISKNFSTLSKASFSKNFHSYKIKVFTDDRIEKIKKAQEILNLLKKEFKIGVVNKFNKYDIWTTVLRKNILNRSISVLNKSEKNKYNLLIFPKIRDITRFTFPETVSAKNFFRKEK